MPSGVPEGLLHCIRCDVFRRHSKEFYEFEKTLQKNYIELEKRLDRYVQKVALLAVSGYYDEPEEHTSRLDEPAVR